MRKRKINIAEELKKKEKVVILDGGYYTHTSIYSWKHNKTLPVSYSYLNMITGDLKRVGTTKKDIVILALDKGKSWRKLIDKEYKANRKAIREKHKDIPWEKLFGEINKINEKIDLYTPIHVISEWGWEADDIMAVTSRQYKDKTVIIISSDSDLEQLFAYKNVMIFSPKSKKFKEIKINPHALLLKKIKKEVSDNLISPIKTEEDYKKRLKIVSLLTLPKEIEENIKDKISLLPSKEIDLRKIGFKKMVEKFKIIFN